MGSNTNYISGALCTILGDSSHLCGKRLNHYAHYYIIIITAIYWFVIWNCIVPITLFIEFCAATSEFGSVARGSFLTGNVWGVSVSGRGQSENERLNPTRLRYHVSHATWLKPYSGGDKSCVILLFSRVECVTYWHSDDGRKNRTGNLENIHLIKIKTKKNYHVRSVIIIF